MLIVLPLAFFVLSWLTMLGSPSDDLPDLRDAFLKAAVLWGVLVTVFAESLGFFGALNQAALAVGWLAALVVVVWLGSREGRVRRGWRSIRSIRLTFSWTERSILAGILASVGLLGFVAFRAPPNTVDSLLYHMPRVAHWAQAESLGHYAASYHNQLFMPIWAEVAVLHLRVLWGSDLLSNLVQWFSMFGSVIGVSAVAAYLGARKSGQVLASAFVMSIPMGILQATSTQNDYVAAFWLVCLVYFLLKIRRTPSSSSELAYFGLALGLGLLTKATVYPYALPFLVWFVASRFGHRLLARGLAEMAAVGVLAASLNFGYWGRNMSTYGSPFGPPDWVRRTVRVQPLRGVQDSPGLSPAASVLQASASFALSRTFTAAARNFVTPSSVVNETLMAAANAVPGWLPSNFEEEMSLAAWSHEDTAGNPLHLAAVPITIVALSVLSLSRQASVERRVWLCVLAVLIGFSFMATIINNGSSLDGLRFQLPFFVLWGSVAGAAFSSWGSNLVEGAFGAGLLLASVPWLLFNNTRPVVGRPPWPTRVESVFVASRFEIMFAMSPHLRNSYHQMASTIQGMDCRDIGLRIDSSDLEYLFWWVLGAPESGYQLETIHTYDRLEHYLETDYEPCIVICTICEEGSRFEGFRFVSEYGDARLYARVDHEDKEKAP